MEFVFVLHLLTSRSPSVTAYGQVKLAVHTDANCVTQSSSAMSLDIRIASQPAVWKTALEAVELKNKSKDKGGKNNYKQQVAKSHKISCRTQLSAETYCT